VKIVQTLKVVLYLRGSGWPVGREGRRGRWGTPAMELHIPSSPPTLTTHMAQPIHRKPDQIKCPNQMRSNTQIKSNRNQVRELTDGGVVADPHCHDVRPFSSSLLLSSLELSDTKVYGHEIRARLGTAAHFCEVCASPPAHTLSFQG